MKEKKDCKIVQDLLPSYIESLTNEESNKFVEEHLNTCKECKNILENMQKDLHVNVQKNDKKEVNYIKKYNKKLRVLKIILLIILAVFVIRTGRNIVIMASMSNKADRYIASNNYHRSSTAYDGEGLTVIDYYYKDSKSVTILQNLSEKGINKITVYNNGEARYNEYYESDGRKTAQLNLIGKPLKIRIINYFESYNILTFIVRAISTSIKSVECNGNECYLVNDYLLRETGTYIDKATGLIVRTNSGIHKNNSTGNITNRLMDVTYEFGTITDEIFIEPDISEYEVKE